MKRMHRLYTKFLARIWRWSSATLGLCLALVPMTSNAQEQNWMPESDQNIKSIVANSGRRFFDLAFNKSRMQQGDSLRGNLALDQFQSDSLHQNLHWVLSGRIDFDGAPGTGIGSDHLSIAVREAYLTYSADPVHFDFGRINIRDGVALAYNPSDVFRTGALPTRRTEDPSRLRESRLGIVAAQIRSSGDFGHIAGLVAPAFSYKPTTAWYDPQLASVNGKDAQYYLKYTPPRWHDIYANLIVHRATNISDTIGLNLTQNLGQQWISYVEWARIKPDYSLASHETFLPLPNRYQQAAIGASYSNEKRQTLSLEYQFNGAGLNRAQWNNEWQSADAITLQDRFKSISQHQDPLGKENLTALLQWDQFSTPNDELTCLYRLSLIDKSRLQWCEWRYKQDRQEWSLSLTHLEGRARSEFGAAPQSLTLGAKLRLFY